MQNSDNPQQATQQGLSRPTELTVFPPTANPNSTDLPQQAKKAQTNNTCLTKWILGLVIALVLFVIGQISVVTINNFFPLWGKNSNDIESLILEMQVSLQKR